MNARCFFSLTASGAAFVFAGLSGANTGPAVAISIGALLMAFFGLRLGLLLIVCAVLMPLVYTYNTSAYFLSTVWLLSLVLMSSAYVRAIIVTTGLGLKRHHLFIPRPVKNDPDLQTDGAEGYRLWFFELLISTFVVTVVHSIIMALARSLSSSFMAGQNTSNQSLAIVTLGLLVVLGALGQLIFTLLRFRKATYLESAMTIMTTLHREIRSELVFFSQFRARRRW
jgi:hypothetical protein